MKALREAWVQAHTLRLSVLDVEQLRRWHFLDETGVHLGMTRLYGRAAPGERVVEGTPGYSGAHYTLVATLGVDGVAAPLLFEGAMNRDTFDSYVDQVLLPTLAAGDVLVLDNLSAHKLPDLTQRLAQKGVAVIFLPPYSSDFNPIELCWSKIKTALRAVKARTCEALIEALKAALRSVSVGDALHWFTHCGYPLDSHVN